MSGSLKISKLVSCFYWDCVASAAHTSAHGEGLGVRLQSGRPACSGRQAWDWRWDRSSCPSCTMVLSLWHDTLRPSVHRRGPSPGGRASAQNTLRLHTGPVWADLDKGITAVMRRSSKIKKQVPREAELETGCHCPHTHGGFFYRLLVLVSTNFSSHGNPVTFLNVIWHFKIRALEFDDTVEKDSKIFGLAAN